MDSDTINRLYKRLAAYENTGMTPEEIEAAEDRRHACKVECLLRKYNELAQKEEGMIVHLPCRLDDTVYIIQSEENAGRKKAHEYVATAKIDCFHIGASGIPVADICTNDGRWYMAVEPTDFYTSKEAAERALAKQQEGEKNHGG